MKDRKHNRILFSWILSLVLILVTSVSNATWQCPDGTPCSLDCPYLQGKTATKSNSQKSDNPHCSQCKPAISATLFQISLHSGVKSATPCLSCSPPQCQIKISSHQIATQSEKFQIAVSHSVIISPDAIYVFTEFAVAIFSEPNILVTQNLLRPYSARAPPLSL